MVSARSTGKSITKFSPEPLMKQAQGTDIVPGNHRNLVLQFRARPSRPLAPIFFGLRLRLRFGLRIADGLRQHLTQLSLGLCGFPLGGFLPLYHQ